MRRHIIILTAMLLTVTSTGAMAEWTFHTTDINNTSDFYIDKTAIRKKGNVAKMWTLVDFKSIQKNLDGSTCLSRRILYEFDCVEIRRRGLTVTNFSDNMGKGEITFDWKEAHENKDNGKWIELPPDTVGMGQWEIACKK